MGQDVRVSRLSLIAKKQSEEVVKLMELAYQGAQRSRTHTLQRSLFLLLPTSLRVRAAASICVECFCYGSLLW